MGIRENVNSGSAGEGGRMRWDGKTAIAGTVVAAWIIQGEVAEWFELTTRTIRDWDLLGLPSRGRGNAREYPMPHVLAWILVYRNKVARGEVVEAQPIEVALGEYASLCARLDKAAGGGTMRWDGKTRVGGTVVSAWVVQEEVAKWFEVTTRTIRDWECLGLPSRRRGNAKEYPMPHLLAWNISYKIREVRGEVVEALPVEVALAEYFASVARDDAVAEGRLKTRPRRYRS